MTGMEAGGTNPTRIAILFHAEPGCNPAHGFLMYVWTSPVHASLMIGASSASWSSVELHEDLRDHFGSTAARTVQLSEASILLDFDRPPLINPRIRFHA